MGIFGNAHSSLETITPDIEKTMASFLRDYYTPKGIEIASKDISRVHREFRPLSTATLSINGKDYQAGYVGKIYGTEGSGVGTLEFYRILEPSDFAELPRINAHLPENNYPIPLQKGYCFLVDIYWVDGRTASHIYRCDGEMINGMLNSHLVLEE